MARIFYGAQRKRGSGGGVRGQELIRIANEHFRDPEMIEWGSRGLGIGASEFRWKEGTVHPELPSAGVLVARSGPVARMCEVRQLKPSILEEGWGPLLLATHSFIHVPAPPPTSPTTLQKLPTLPKPLFCPFRNESNHSI